MDAVDEESRIASMQDWLLGGVKGDAATGTYSDLHGNAVYKLGYDHTETIRLARMFCHVLDARKSGLQVKADVMQRDMKSYGGDIEWRSWKKGQDGGQYNVRVVQRGRQQAPFIMDELMQAGKVKRDSIMASFPSEINPPSFKDYQDLSTAWIRAGLVATRRPDDPLEYQMDTLKRHVEACYRIRQQIISRRACDVEETYKTLLEGGTPVTTPRKERSTYTRPVKKRAESAESSLEMLKMTRQLALIWKSKPPQEDISLLAMWGEEIVRELKISCAVCLSEKGGKARQLFPFDMDFDGVCAMKAKAGGRGSKTVTKDLYSTLKPGYKGSGR
ncbi:hypothetical protein IAR55_002446 [Kwoniella newhampshirensis]|uniref:Uncharacterized protein n=1 Tax=Kwoniella newhampshirensis TaxID=1651941 RepID=A0AAW0Z196_9TREE